jgi:carboxyl-terminal processing protease
MESFRNLARLGVAVLVAIIIMTSAFFVGYVTGRSGLDQPSSDQSSVLSQVRQNTVTPLPVPADIATETPDVSPTPTSSLENGSSEAETLEDLPEATVFPSPTVLSDNNSSGDSSAMSEEEALNLLREVWSLVNEEYYGELPSTDEQTYGAIRGMLNTLDDEYTSFTEPQIAEIRRADASGSFEGIGALVNMNEDGILQIVEPYEDSPAAKAGLRAGDLVLAVDGKSIEGYGIYEAIALIRGPEGTQVKLKIKRGDQEPFEVTITRARQDIRIVESEMLPDNIGYVSLYEFSSKATLRLEQAIQELLDQGASSLIFDLRGNPGGFLPQAVQVSDLFLPNGLILIERRSDGQEIEYTSTDAGLAEDIPLVVLVNGGSASASEIVAGAIQDRDRGVLIGETTFGKGSVQLLHTLSDGSELRVTVARWFTPNDRAIHGEGLEPDIVVPLTAEDHEAGQDPQLDRAIEYLQTGS